MSSTQHQLIEQCAIRLRGIVEALDNIHDTSPHRWSTDLDDVHSSAESLLAMIKDQAPPSEDQLIAAGLSYPLAKEDAVQLWYAGFRSEVVTVLEAWEAIGHDIGMNPSKGELLDSLRNMAAICNAHGNDMPAQSAIDQRQAIADAITGALAFGAQASQPPAEDHWLRPFYDIGRAEGQRTQELAMLVRMLAASLKRHAPESNLVARATNYLAAKGLAGTPLRDPPAPVEQAGGDERAAFEAWATHLPMDRQPLRPDLYMPQTQWAWEAWQFRAALAQPSQSQYEASFEEWLANELEGEDGQPVPAAVCDITLARRAFNHWPKLEQPAKVGGVRFSAGVSSRLVVEAAQRLYEFESTPEQEAERPEVVAYRTIGRHEKHQHPHYALNYYKQNAEDQAAHWRERGCEVSEDELMTVAQHDRIFGALRADRDSWAEQAEQRLADWDEMRKERDAALAEVERLRQFERICEGLPQDAIDGGWTVQGIRCYAKRLEDQLKSALARVAELTANRNRYGVDAHYFNKNLQRILRDFESFTPDELARSLIILAKVADEKVVAQHSVPEISGIGRDAEHPRAVVLYLRNEPSEEDMRAIQNFLRAISADVLTQAQHSVPDGWLIELGFDVLDRQFRFADAKSHLPTIKIVLPACEVDDSAAWELRNSVAARIEKLIAAAPGNSVPQAWLDVQAERRRQITAEGWTPEHDDEHDNGEMARAAACYALAGSSAPSDGTAALLVSLAWPWDEQWWKPSTARRDMVKACALGLAEIERLDRVAASQGGPSDA